jgi:hypothetical protein
MMSTIARCSIFRGFSVFAAAGAGAIKNDGASMTAELGIGRAFIATRTKLIDAARKVAAPKTATEAAFKKIEAIVASYPIVQS